MKKILTLCFVLLFYKNALAISLDELYDVKPEPSSCEEGVLKKSEKLKVLDKLNAIRKLHGLKPVSYNETDDALTAKSALIMQANATLTHAPDKSMKCWSEEGAKGSGKSNLFIGFASGTKDVSTSESFVTGWLIDDGVDSLGHRRWLIDPFLKYVSFGRVDGKPVVNSEWETTTGAAISVINNESASIKDMKGYFVAYPYQNYSNELFNKNWLLSFTAIYDKSSVWNNSGANYAGAKITVTNEAGNALSVHSVSHDNTGFGVPNIIQWKVNGLQDNVKYTVKISNVMIEGKPKEYAYWFKLSDETPEKLISSNETAPTETPATDTSVNTNKKPTKSDAFLLSAGRYHTCAVTASGRVKCWGVKGDMGTMFSGQLGEGVTNGSATPVEVKGLSDVSSISVSMNFNCALTSSGGVKCWGANAGGELGDGTKTDRLTPVDVVGLSSGVTSFSIGFDHACAVTASGRVKCWGGNQVAQLGFGTKTGLEECSWSLNTGETFSCSATPVDAKGLSGVVSISVGDQSACALTSSGRVKCWGANRYGKLGLGTSTGPETCTFDGEPCSTAPVEVPGLSDVAAISVGDDHACALTGSGRVKCWGVNNLGQLGLGTAAGPETCTYRGANIACSTIPREVQGLSDVVSISLGSTHTCALTGSGHVNCWGDNRIGRLGLGANTGPQMCTPFIDSFPCSTTPVEVKGLSGVVSISAGDDHTCALTSSARVMCWGDNEDAQLGDGTTNNSATPVEVTGFIP